MNIFAVDESPEVAARQLPNKLVVKMPTETVQIVANAFCVERLKSAPCTRSGNPYKHSYSKHPCTLWATATIGNLTWTIKHGIALCEEYTERYKKIHYASHFLKWALANIGASKVVGNEHTPFAQAMPDIYKSSSAVVSYRNYMRQEKAYYAVWPEGKTPHWWHNAT